LGSLLHSWTKGKAQASRQRRDLIAEVDLDF
jgi:hypothetical protein